MRELEALPYYRWHWRDYRANRKVQRMTYVERGLYRELLDECWAEGFIPDDLDALAGVCGCSRQVLEGCWPTLRACLEEVSPGTLINPRMDRERTEKDAERTQKAIAGARGGCAKTATVQAEAKQVLSMMEQEISNCHIAIAGAKAEQEHKQEQASSAEPSGSTPASAVITLPLNSRTGYPISPEQLNEWSLLFPAVNVMQELRNMRAWLDANPTRRKTNGGIKRFVVGWLSKEQDNPGPISERYAPHGAGSQRTQRNRAALEAVKQRNVERFGRTTEPDRRNGDSDSGSDGYGAVGSSAEPVC